MPSTRAEPSELPGPHRFHICSPSDARTPLGAVVLSGTHRVHSTLPALPCLRSQALRLSTFQLLVRADSAGFQPPAAVPSGASGLIQALPHWCSQFCQVPLASCLDKDRHLLSPPWKQDQSHCLFHTRFPDPGEFDSAGQQVPSQVLHT